VRAKPSGFGAFMHTLRSCGIIAGITRITLLDGQGFTCDGSAMQPQLITGLAAIAPDYDALICDVWGVLHNGHSVYPEAAIALKKFRDHHGPVVLLSNAPRPASDLVRQFAGLGVPPDCYDSIITSGGAARADLIVRTQNGPLAMMHLGPERDYPIYEGLNVVRVDPAEAQIVLCTGLYNDETESPAMYGPLLEELRSRGLTMLCANPDIRVPRGPKMVWCAGALAEAYEELGGEVIYYGKPYTPIYDVALAATKGAAKPLAVGDGLFTDMKGADAAGLDALFIADGLHGEEVEPYTPEHMAALFERSGVTARAVMRALSW
jgi:HAD superfamily hydrolase (TIGR01459 family)